MSVLLTLISSIGENFDPPPTKEKNLFKLILSFQLELTFLQSYTKIEDDQTERWLFSQRMTHCIKRPLKFVKQASVVIEGPDSPLREG